MATRIEVTKKLKQGYKTASKAKKGHILDRFCEVTGLSRSSARRYLTSDTLGNPRVVRIDKRKAKPRKYSLTAQKFLVRLWKLEGMPCGKHMAASMSTWLDALERHEEFVVGKSGYTTNIRAELESMSPATIDRYLKEHRDKLALKGIATTKPGALLRNSVKIRTATDEVEDEPGFFEVDTVAHCGPTLKGEFARTVSFTDVHTGWIHLEVIRNNAAKHILASFDSAWNTIPYGIAGLDCDNGSEFINHEVLSWAADKNVYFTRSRPYRKNDQAYIESKNNHTVRKYGFHYRYDTDEERRVLGLLWEKVTVKLNYFTPTQKPVGWTENANGKRRRIRDTPTTPYQRLLESKTLSAPQIAELNTIYESINPAELTRDIVRLQGRLIELARTKTETLVAQTAQKQQQREHTYQTGITIRIS